MLVKDKGKKQILLCILVSVIQMQLLAMISKGGLKNIFALSNVGGNNVKSIGTKLYCARDELRGDSVCVFPSE